MNGTTCDRKLRQAEDDARYYRRLAEQAQEEERQRQRERDERIDLERREARQRMQQAMMEAQDWDEAFQKQIWRVRDELEFLEGEVAQARAGAYDHCKEIFGGDPAGFWQKKADEVRAGLASIEKAKALYHAKMIPLETRHAEERKAVLAELAEEVKLLPGEAWYATEYLQNDDPSGWLYW